MIEYNNEIITSITNNDVEEGVLRITKNVFPRASKNLEVTKILIQEGVTEIGDFAFTGSTVKIIVLPKSLKRIGHYAFAECKNLTKVIGSPINFILGTGAFRDDRRLKHVGSMRVKKISLECFKNCESLDYFEFSKKTETIKPYAFANTGLAEVSLKDVNIGRGAFNKCQKLRNATISNCILEEEAFSYCSKLLRATIINNTSFQSMTFMGCEKLKEVFLDSSIRRIENGTFCDCKKLANIYENNITEIGDYGFYGTGLKATDFKIGTDFGECVFSDNPKSKKYCHHE